jgi:predicted esterase
MKYTTIATLLLSLLLNACAGEEDDPNFEGSDSAVIPGLTGTDASMAGALHDSSFVPPPGAVGDASSSPPLTPGGMGGGPEAGIGTDAGSVAADAAMVVVPSEGGVQVAPGALAPIIPEPMGECPQLRSGMQMVNGLSVNLVAGTPGAAKGPMVITWHGTGGSGAQALGQLPQSVQRDITNQGGIIVAPSDQQAAREGQDVTFVLGVWYDIGDLKTADQIVACAVKNHNIDPRRIYTTGCSAGGLMSGVMALTRSNYIAAAAPNSGGIATAGAWKLQDPKRVPAVMTMHGGSGDTVITNFQETSNYLISALKPAGAFLVDCNHMMGHCRAPAALHELAWEFMKAHPYGVGTSPYKAGLPSTFPAYCTVK